MSVDITWEELKELARQPLDYTEPLYLNRSLLNGADDSSRQFLEREASLPNPRVVIIENVPKRTGEEV